MIAALLLGVALASPQVVEVRIPDAEAIHIQALVKLPKLDARELGAAQLLTATLSAGTSDLTGIELRRLAGFVGYPLTCTLMPDHIRIAFAVSKSDLPLASRILEDLLRKATFPDESINPLLETMPFRRRSFFTEALDPAVPRFDRVTRETIVKLYTHIFRPENVFVAVGGAFAPGQGKAEMTSRFASWSPDRDTYPKFHMVDFPKSVVARRRPITTLELACPETPLGSSGFPAELVAAAALSMGKGATLFRVVREGMGLSYKQDAFYWPSEGGVRLRIVVTMAPRPDEDTLPEQVRAGILKDIDTWTEADLARAKAVLRAALAGGEIPGPFWFRSDRPLDSGDDDRTLLAAYWRMKTGGDYDQEALLASCASTNLEQIKAAAKRTVAGAQTSLISGR
jgi:predicted Zn-dependent peptidase